MIVELTNHWVEMNSQYEIEQLEELLKQNDVI